MISSLKDKLFPIIVLLQANKIAEAKSVLSQLNIVDTPLHLAQPKEIRHLIWDLYEFLEVANIHYTSKEEILNTFSKVFK